MEKQNKAVDKNKTSAWAKSIELEKEGLGNIHAELGSSQPK